MTIACPRCGARYRVPPAATETEVERYRCTRCRHVFQPEPAGEPAPIAELDLDDSDEPDDDFTLGDEAEDDGPAPAATRSRPAPREKPAPPEPTGASPARFALRALLIVTVGYAVLSIYLYTHPEAMRQALGRVPIIGSRLAETRINPTSVQLTNLEATYQRVQGDQLVFVISGIAINNSPVTVKAVQVEGRAMGEREERQVVFAGTAPRDVQGLSAREIALLQTLEPPKDAALGPGEQATFAVVFVNPPPGLKEFSAEVVAVQAKPHRRPGAPDDDGDSDTPGH
jgi:predicted Zn finger-like uncharacterized protein